MKLELSFGALAPSLQKQFKVGKVKVRRMDVYLWQNDADNITRLLIRGLLTDGAATAARRKLMRKIISKVVAKQPLQGTVK